MFFKKIMFRFNLYINKTINRSRSTVPTLTSSVYNVKRKKFAILNEQNIKHFKFILSGERVLTDSNDVLKYNVDWMMDYKGQAKVVLKPKNTEEVSKILNYCNENNLAVCPHAGNTSLSGGCTPVFDEVVLSMELMNEVIDIDETSGVIVCQAGCVLENLENVLKEYNLIMPIDLGAKGSCQIGGNVSTNAGGIRLYRYGNLHGNVLGLEAVLANGEVIDALKTLKKDNTGYHLKHLFIGSEGTLGIITKVAVQCPVIPKSIILAYIGVNSFYDVLKVFRGAKISIGEIVSAFEMADNDAFGASFKYLDLKNPIADCPFYVIIETNGSNDKHDNEKLKSFIDGLLNDRTIIDGMVTDEPHKMALIWKLRESIPSCLQKEGHFYTYDVSLPLDNYYEIIPKVRAKVGSSAIRVCGFGHIGDGNLHINLTKENFDKNWAEDLEIFIYEEVSKLKGSISAEHGIGFRKKEYLHYSKDDAYLKFMYNIKQIMDPKNILNPYKMFPNKYII